MMLAQIRIDAPKNGARRRDAHISVDIVVGPGDEHERREHAAVHRPRVAPRAPVKRW